MIAYLTLFLLMHKYLCFKEYVDMYDTFPTISSNIILAFTALFDNVKSIIFLYTDLGKFFFMANCPNLPTICSAPPYKSLGQSLQDYFFFQEIKINTVPEIINIP